jgi:hypothetical protein
VISRDEEELEEFRAAIEIGATPAKLRELFGGNRVPVLERLDAADRASKAKVVEAEVIEIVPEVPAPLAAKPKRVGLPPAEPEPTVSLEDI